MAQVRPLLSSLRRTAIAGLRQRRSRLGIVAIVCLLTAVSASALNDPVQTYFVPLDEDDVAAALLPLELGFDPDGDGPAPPISSVSQIRRIESIVSIVTTADGTTVYYDHWEDGYDEPLSPSQATTEILRDSDDQTVLDAGTVLTLRNTVRRSDRGEVLVGEQVYYYDGGDRIWADNPIAVTRVVWDAGEGRGAALAGAVEVYDTSRWGKVFVAPIGEDLESMSMFERTVMLVMAQRRTEIEVFESDGTSRGTTTLDAGKSVLVEQVTTGTRIEADQAVQAYLLAGDTRPEGQWELRTFSLLPREAWSSSYLTPVGNSQIEEEFWVPAGDFTVEDACGDGFTPPPDENFLGPVTQPEDQTFVWLYNPGTEAITIEFEGASSPVDPVTVGAGSTEFFEMPEVDRGGRFASTDDEPFFALTTVGALFNPAEGEWAVGVFRDAQGFCDFSDGPKDNDSYDWGFTLVPERFASTRAVVGWGPGNSYDDPRLDDQGQQVDANGSPIWVMPLEATNVRVDYDGDLSTLNDSDERAVAAFESQKFFDYVNLDNDQTGALVESFDPPVPLVVAWGADPDTAGGAQPYLDLGTAVFAIPEVLATVNTEVVGAVNPGLADPGESIWFEILVGNGSEFATLTGITLEASLPEGATYLTGSTSWEVVDVVRASRSRASSGAIPDDGVGSTFFPLDEGGWLAPSLVPGQRLTVSFGVTVDLYDPGLCEPPGGDFVTSATISGNDVETETVSGSAARYRDCDLFEDDFETGDSSRWSRVVN